ncbi:MAG: hypothetical protein IJY05_03065 [Clostridia bacterium]|nr:hypothetical protein [Clostridia bacterium]
MGKYKTCGGCSNGVYVSEGCTMCLVGDEPKVVMDDWEPTEDYMWCDGEHYDED